MGKDYVIERKNVCGGLLMHNSQALRGMMLSVNQNNTSNDLRYEYTLQYRIEGLNPKVPVGEDFIVNFFVKLEELLKHEKYGEMLTQKELNNAFATYIADKHWLDKHMELFGYKKNGNGWTDGGVETISREIYTPLREIVTPGLSKPNPLEHGYQRIKAK